MLNVVILFAFMCNYASDSSTRKMYWFILIWSDKFGRFDLETTLILTRWDRTDLWFRLTYPKKDKFMGWCRHWPILCWRYRGISLGTSPRHRRTLFRHDTIFSFNCLFSPTWHFLPFLIMLLIVRINGRADSLLSPFHVKSWFSMFLLNLLSFSFTVFFILRQNEWPTSISFEPKMISKYLYTFQITWL